jgi:hypothetical protein
LLSTTVAAPFSAQIAQHFKEINDVKSMSSESILFTYHLRELQDKKHRFVYKGALLSATKNCLEMEVLLIGMNFCQIFLPWISLI